jgi:hypothetical protein
MSGGSWTQKERALPLAYMQQHVLDQMACCFFAVEEMPTVWYALVTFQIKCPFLDMFFYGECNLNL